MSRRGSFVEAVAETGLFVVLVVLAVGRFGALLGLVVVSVVSVAVLVARDLWPRFVAGYRSTAGRPGDRR